MAVKKKAKVKAKVKAGKKAAAKKAAPKKAAPKKVTAAKKAAPQKAAFKKVAPKKAKAKKATSKKASAERLVTKKAVSKQIASRQSENPKAPARKVDESSITPLEDRIIVAIESAPEKTAGGIIIPFSTNDRPTSGKVLAVGRGRRNKKGAVRPMDVNVGDQVMFAELSGTKITMNGSEVLILREEDVLGVMS